MGNEENKVEIMEPSASTTKTAKQNRSKVEVQKFPDIEGKFLLVRVGTEDRPASDQDIKDIEEKLNGLLSANDVNCLVFVTHHAVEVEVIEKQPEPT
jgi:hypothetical protein